MKKVFALITLILILAGCSSSTGGKYGAPPAPTNTGVHAPYPHWKIGQVVDTDDNIWEFTVLSVKAAPDVRVQNAGDVMLVFDLRIRNLSATPQPMSAFFWELRDTSGTKYNDQFLGSPYSDVSGDVPDHGIDHGQVGFEVPSDQHEFTLTFSNFANDIIWDIKV